MVDGSEEGVLGSISRRAVEEVFMNILDRLMSKGVNVSHNKNAGNFAPRVFAKQPDRDGHDRRAFEAAMYRLLQQNRIAVEPYGRAGDERQHIVRSMP